MQRLAAAENGGQGLERGTHDVDLGLLRGEGDTRGLRVETQEPRARVLRPVALAQLLGPDPARGAILRDLFEEVDVRVEEEGKPGSEVVDVEPALDAGLELGEPAGEREGELR